MLVKEIESEQDFRRELADANFRLVLAYFTAKWCGPCQKIKPFVNELSVKYKNVVFLKIDIEKCESLAMIYEVSALPSFLFFRNKARVSRVSGADQAALEREIVKLSGDDSEIENNAAGFIDLKSFILKSGTECLNEADNHPLAHCLFEKSGFLESDCDEQLIISITFKQPMKIHSLKFQAPEDKGPKNIRIFINQPRTLDFDQAEAIESVQDFQLTADELKNEPIELRFVKFQNVQNLQLFIKNNQANEETTVINALTVYGLPISVTNMNELKRLSGKKNESH